MKYSLRIGLFVLTLLLPAATLAAPENVTGITATREGEHVRVTWQPVAGPIRSYRIFHSSASILANGGLFDDFETVDGSVNTHLLRNIPPSNALSVAVLAVDANGEESPFFVEEATVTLSASSRPSLVPTPSLAPSPTDTGAALLLLEAKAVSATEVRLTFSHPVAIPTERALETIVIESSDGTRLRLHRITASGTMLAIETLPQIPGVIYRVLPGSDITGTDIHGRALALSSDTPSLLFAGFIAAGSPGPSPAPAPVSDPALPPATADITGLSLRAQPTGSVFLVEANWRAPAQPISGYELLQTTDGGHTFGAVTNVPSTTTGVRIADVTPGTFGVLIRAVRMDGTRSSGLTQVIDLPGAVLSPSPLTGQVQPPTTTTTQWSGSLTGSGPGLWLLLTLAGAMVGLLTLRQRKRWVVEGVEV